MKHIKILLVGISFFYNFIIAQVPTIQWQRTFGGTKDEIAYSTCNIKEGGYMIIGNASSDDGDLTNLLFPGDDGAWLIKLDSLGNLKLNKCLGGSGSDEVRSITQTFDGGFILAGSTTSTDGDVTGLHSLGRPDYWVVKIDSVGIIQWQKCLGGTEHDDAQDIIQTADSGYLVTGRVGSSDGDVIGFHGGDDMWVVKLNQNGVKQWTRSLGGLDYERGNSCKQTSDGGYLIAGDASSVNGDVTGLHGILGVDAWVVKLNSLGQLQWQKCYGGTRPENANEIILSNNGGFYLSSSTSSIDGDVTGSFGFTDFWLVKADSLETIQWQKCFGGAGIESPTSSDQTSDGGIVIIGAAETNNGMVSGIHGDSDYWVCKVDSLGNFVWGKALGGTGAEYPFSIRETPDGGFLAAGYTTSTDGDVTSNHGGKDYWIVKLAPLGLTIPEVENSLMELNIFQNNDQLNLRFYSKHNQQAQLFLYDVNGKKVFEKNIFVNEGINYNSVNCVEFAKGMYFMRLDGGKGELGGRFVIE